MEVTLLLNTYKVKLIETKGEDSEPILTADVNGIDKGKDLVKSELVKLNPEEVNIQLKIKEYAEKARDYNKVKIKLAKSKNSNECNWQIVTTDNN